MPILVKSSFARVLLRFKLRICAPVHFIPSWFCNIFLNFHIHPALSRTKK